MSAATQWLMIWRTAEKSQPPTPEHMAAMGQFIEESTRSGVLVATGGLTPSATGARVRSTGGKVTVTDGPFTETKELIGGFAIVRAATKAEAIAQATRFLGVPGVGDGECEVRQMHQG